MSWSQILNSVQFLHGSGFFDSSIVLNVWHKSYTYGYCLLWKALVQWEGSTEWHQSLDSGIQGCVETQACERMDPKYGAGSLRQDILELSWFFCCFLLSSASKDTCSVNCPGQGGWCKGWQIENYPCQWALVECPGFLLVTFRTVRSLMSFGFFQVGLATFKYGLAVQSETYKTPSMLQACSFFSNPLLELCFLTIDLTPLFLPPCHGCSTSSSKHLTLWKFQCIALEPEILWKRWFTWALFVHACFTVVSHTMKLSCCLVCVMRNSAAL